MTQDEILKIANDMAFMASIWIEDDSDEFKDMIKFAQLVAEAEKERIAKKIEQLPFGDTAQSFAIWIRNDT